MEFGRVRQTPGGLRRSATVTGVAFSTPLSVYDAMSNNGPLGLTGGLRRAATVTGVAFSTPLSVYVARSNTGPLGLPGGFRRSAWVTVGACAASLSLAHGLKLLAFACR
jgi:hypothetical protein